MKEKEQSPMLMLTRIIKFAEHMNDKNLSINGFQTVALHLQMNLNPVLSDLNLPDKAALPSMNRFNLKLWQPSFLRF